MAKLTILLDMDGVLSSFTGGVCNLFGHDPAIVISTWPEGVKGIHKALGITQEEMWERVNAAGEDFWANLKPTPWAGDLWNMLSKYGDITILSSPSQGPASPAGKVRWMDEHLGHGKPWRDFLLGPRKHLCSMGNAVLIDDHDKQVDAFNNGDGVGIVFPRPWNSQREHANDPLEYVDAEVSRLHRYLNHL